jgi:hypothetical protein
MSKIHKLKRIYIIIFLIFFIFQLALNAQINTHTINITANTSTDTTLKRLSGIISGPIQPYESLAPDLTERFQEIGVFSVRNNDYHNDMLGIEYILRGTVILMILPIIIGKVPIHFFKVLSTEGLNHF